MEEVCGEGVCLIIQLGNSIIKITPAAKGGFFAAKSKFVYWNEILGLVFFFFLLGNITKNNQPKKRPTTTPTNAHGNPTLTNDFFL